MLIMQPLQSIACLAVVLGMVYCAIVFIHSIRNR